MRLPRALLAAAITIAASCTGPTLSHAQDSTTNRNTVQAPVVRYPAICLADSLKKSTVAGATREQCAKIKAHVDSANQHIAVARQIHVTGAKTPPKPTTHPPPSPHPTPDSTISPVDTLKPPVAPILSGLAIVTQPGGAASGGTLTPQPVVKFVDQFGATFNSTNTITATRAAGVATLTGGTSLSATSGVAAFSTIGATTATTGSNTITFASSGLPSVTSAAFTVTAPPPPPPLNPPTIASFTASPSTLSSAGNVTLTWSTSGATSLSISAGVGTVTGTTRTVAVTATTTFTLTATNSAGSATANATVTLVPAGSLPPTPGVAELPRAIVDVTYPTPTRSYKIAAGANLQTVLDTAKLGDEIRLAPGAVWTGSYILSKKTSGTGTIVLRTDTSDAVIGAPGTRMTPTRAAAAQLAKITSNVNNSPPIGTADSAHHWRLTGLEIASTAVQMNQLVRFGDAGSNGQTVFANVPGDLILDRSYVHTTPTGDLKRCVAMHSSSSAIVDSWLAECHSNFGDAQAINGYNGPGPFYIRNNHLEASHEVIMWGGADPVSAQFSPADITVVYNHFTRPTSWKSSAPGTNTYNAGQWGVKNLYESKNGCRQLIQGNVFENEWFDAQAGYAILFKSENQDGTAPYTQTCDVTVRFNLIQNVASVFNLSGKGSLSTPNITAARVTVHDNYATGINAGIFTGDGIPVQVLGIIDGVVVHNTFINSGGSLEAISMDGAAAIRFIFDSNVLYHGTYGIKGSGTSDGTSTLSTYAPSYEFLSNAIIGGNINGNSCGVYPATTQCPNVLGSVTGNGPDGRPLGADMSSVNAQTAGVVVAP